MEGNVDEKIDREGEEGGERGTNSEEIKRKGRREM